MNSLKVYPRSHWTASTPRPILSTDEFDGLPYFDEPPVGIEFCQPNDEILYVYRNPVKELERLRQQAIQGTGFTDIDYNYAISQNTEGVYILRGGITKCIRTNKYKVLMLMGNNEDPTDIMKKNQDTLINEEVKNSYPVGPLSLGQSDVHVFNLIEFLAEHGLYQNRNDGIYSIFVEHSIQKLQKDLKLNITGEYSLWVINALDNLNREFISAG